MKTITSVLFSTLLFKLKCQCENNSGSRTTCSIAELSGKCFTNSFRDIKASIPQGIPAFAGMPHLVLEFLPA